ncbi:MAG: AgmX/PglI C-terminal domain-containing protein [Gammaproteobacteria bacterium]
MAAALSLYRVYDLPWVTGWEQDQAFRRIALQAAGALLLLSVILGVVPLPEPDPTEIEEIPNRFARLVLEREEAPPPPPPVVIEEEPVPEPEPEPVVEQLTEPEIIPEPVVEVPVEPVETVEPVEDVQAARERASVAGLLPFAAELASLRDNEALESLGETDVVGATESDAPSTDRSLITSAALSSSGGIDTSSFSRTTGGSGLVARATTQVENPLEDLAPAGGNTARTGSSDLPSRSREEIELVFDRNKGAIFALYNRALRSNPLLEGKLLLRLTIEPSGAVSFCEVVSSELGDPDLEQKLVQRVLLFQFEAKDVEAITTTKPIDFFPA